MGAAPLEKGGNGDAVMAISMANDPLGYGFHNSHTATTRTCALASRAHNNVHIDIERIEQRNEPIGRKASITAIHELRNIRLPNA